MVQFFHKLKLFDYFSEILCSDFSYVIENFYIVLVLLPTVLFFMLFTYCIMVCLSVGEAG